MIICEDVYINKNLKPPCVCVSLTVHSPGPGLMSGLNFYNLPHHHHLHQIFCFSYCSSCLSHLLPCYHSVLPSFGFPSINHSVPFSFCPPCPLVSGVLPLPESVVSSSSHPGGARAPSGGRDCQRPARPGPAQTHRHHVISGDLHHHVDGVHGIMVSLLQHCRSPTEPAPPHTQPVWI